MSTQKHKIQTIYNVLMEEPGGYYFIPEGVLVIDTIGQFTLYCADSIHNFIRTVIQKYRYQDLQEGVQHKEYTIRIEDLSDKYLTSFGNTPDQIPFILEEIHQTSPRQYHFLNRYIWAQTHQNPFVP